MALFTMANLNQIAFALLFIISGDNLLNNSNGGKCEGPCSYTIFQWFRTTPTTKEDARILIKGTIEKDQDDFCNDFCTYYARCIHSNWTYLQFVVMLLPLMLYGFFFKKAMGDSIEDREPKIFLWISVFSFIIALIEFFLWIILPKYNMKYDALVEGTKIPGNFNVSVQAWLVAMLLCLLNFAISFLVLLNNNRCKVMPVEDENYIAGQFAEEAYENKKPPKRNKKSAVPQANQQQQVPLHCV
uniref:Uncharacterized protein n=1 Tax=Rhabditophanes sp. KR3021 TaxID=114890 RepID=A0AC35TG98_9BILA